MSFVVLQVQTPASRFSDGASQYLFLRQNTPKPPLQDDGCMLFFANLPSDTTEGHLRSLIAKLGGRVEMVQLHNRGPPSDQHLSLEDVSLELDLIEDQDFSAEVKRLKVASALPAYTDYPVLASGSTAHVKLVEAQEVKRVLKATQSASNLVWESPEGSELGIARYKRNIAMRFPDAAVLQASVDAYMELFNQEEILRRRKQKRMRSEPDEDGFVTITRGGRTGAGRASQAIKQLSAKEERKIGMLDDLYKFQRRDAQKVQRDELRNKFEQDKRRVAELKERRKFKPL